jgi:hypothetical protein
MRSGRGALLVISIGLAAPNVRAADRPPEVVKLGDEELRIDLPELAEVKSFGPVGDQRKAAWSGKLGASAIWIELRAYSRIGFGFAEPQDVSDRIAENFAKPDDDGDADFRWSTQELVAGPFGAAPYASICTGTLPRGRKDTGSPGDVLVLGGVLDQNAYSLRVYARPATDVAGRARLREFLAKGIRAACKARDPDWTDEEARKRCGDSVRDEKVLEDMEKFARTRHYIVFTNSSAGPLFAKKMEECYDAIRKAFPFPEVVGRRLMPVFLFRTPDEYYDYCVKTAGWSLAQAKKSKGHAGRDYYATYYDSPNDPVHVHEATHQIFGNRLRLTGGGSWFQEGVAEYMETTHSERKAYARRATRDGKYIAFKDFVQIRSLLHSGGVDSSDAYHQAGSLIEFLRDGDFHPDLFPRFVQEIGVLPRGNLALVEGTIRKIYAVDLAGLEHAWCEYWKK